MQQKAAPKDRFLETRTVLGVLAAEADNEAGGGDSEVQVVVRGVHGEQAQDGAAHEAEDRDETVDQSEDDEVHAGVRQSGADGKEGDDAGEDVDDVVDRINLEDDQRVSRKEAGHADEEENDTQNPGERFHKGVHRVKGEEVRNYCEH